MKIFMKIVKICPKSPRFTVPKEKNFLQKMNPHLSQLQILQWLIGIILGKKKIVNPQIGNIYKD